MIQSKRLSERLPPHFVLLRGLSRQAVHWHHFPSILLKRFPGATCEAVDLPGVGAARERSSPWTLSGIAADVRARYLLPGDGRPVHLIAISLGAMVAMEWLREHPTGVRSAVFINTSLNILSPFWERLRPRQYPRLLRIASSSRPSDREREILQMTSRMVDVSQLLPRWTEWAEVHPIPIATSLAQLAAAATYAGSLEAPPRPVLLLRSLGDELVHPRASEKIARTWGVPLVTHPAAGHDLPLDDPHWVVEQIHRFLAGLA